MVAAESTVSAQFDLAAWCFVFVLYRSGMSRLESITVNPESPNIPVSLADRTPAGWDLAEASKICTACTASISSPPASGVTRFCTGLVPCF
ncbi:MAG: hypothetical protein ACI90Z_002394 [Cyanobium sp.]|jgi:hypothetical protein